MALWEWEPDFNVQKGLQVFNTRKDPTTGAYGPEFIYDEVPPVENVTLKAHGMTLTEVLALRTKILTPGGSDTYATTAGITLVGMPVSLQAAPIPVSDDTGTYRYNVTLSVRRTDLI